MNSLSRFLDAQAAPSASFDDALAEIQSGGKRSHWIWYIFPQLRGLGSSPTAQFYGLEGVREAEAYVQDDTLRQRLIGITAAANAQLARGVPLRTLMGSEIDALKVVSSMTLFEHVASILDATGVSPTASTLAREASTLLDAAAKQGYPRCERTQALLGGASR